jgi:hypothetical protein
LIREPLSTSQAPNSEIVSGGGASQCGHPIWRETTVNVCFPQQLPQLPTSLLWAVPKRQRPVIFHIEKTCLMSPTRDMNHVPIGDMSHVPI